MDDRPDFDAQPDFDEVIDRRGTQCSKWDDMGSLYPVSDTDGLAMWVADMDFRPPASVTRALTAAVDHGVYGYPGRNDPYTDAIRWWMQTRHGWDVPREAILNVHGLVNGVAVAVDVYTQPGDRVIITTPVYHAFARVIQAAGREVAELPLATGDDGAYLFDWATWESLLTGRERMFILCSPHNPGGRVWTADELRDVADFCERHDLILISDEIHHDLLMPGQKHHVTATVAPQITNRLLTMTAGTKTFNIAGAHLGNVIITDKALRDRYAARLGSLGISPGLFGLPMVTAAYSPEGAAWVDALTAYLDGNRRLFDAGVNAIPGLASMPLQATYLAWVDFAGTGMTREEFTARVERQANIAANHGTSFGRGGESFLRFNLATPRARVAEAVERLQAAFGDLQ